MTYENGMRACHHLGGATLPSFRSNDELMKVNDHFEQFGDWWLGAKAKESGRFMWSR